jgi:hypothetical protein
VYWKYCSPEFAECEAGVITWNETVWRSSMRISTHTSAALLLAGSLVTPAVGVAQGPSMAKAAADWSAVETALGRKGAPQPGDVMKFSFPRSDLTVTARGVHLMPAFALGSWVAFKRISKSNAMVMGDLVLLEDDVGPVMQKLQADGVEQTALHNHVLGETPRIMYMHINAHGDETRIAQTIHDALALTKTPLGTPAPASTAPVDLDSLGIAKALGYSGKINGGVYQVTVSRADKVTEGGMEIPASMGIATAINFEPTGDGKAAITGDFVMTAGEVNRVIRALRSHGIEVTALHSHMLTESPRLFFMHFWANDNAVTLATGLHAALSEMRVQPAIR